MSNSLLERIRTFNQIFQNSQTSGIDLYKLCNTLGKVLECCVTILDSKGYILGYAFVQDGGKNIGISRNEQSTYVSGEYNSLLLKIRSTRANNFDVPDTGGEDCPVTVAPVYYGGDRLGTIVFERINKEMFTDDDLVMVEYAAMVVALEIMRIKTEIMNEDERKRSMVEMAMGTLSYSEFEAVGHVFRELKGSEGLLVASKIADREGITRSVIVNALRKLESAGIIESRSLGMKGTYIKVLNDKLLSQLERMQ